MDQRTTYGEISASAALTSLGTFLDEMRDLTAELASCQRIVQPIITPRFVPVCSDKLLHALTKVSEERGVRVQSHMCESRDQMAWVEAQRGRRDEVVFDDVRAPNTLGMKGLMG